VSDVPELRLPPLTAEDLAPLAVPAGLAALTLSTVIAFDAPTMLPLIVLWCTVWIATLTPTRVAGWSAPAQRVALATGLAWTALFAAMLFTQTTWTLDGYVHVRAGWPCHVSVGTVPLGSSAWQSNLAWLWSPASDVAPPRMRLSNECASNLWCWGAASAFVALWLPSRWLLSLLTVVRIAAPTTVVLALGLIPFDTWVR
jgi:hypothetical protein